MFVAKKIISAFLLPVPIAIFLLFLAFLFLLFNSYKKAKLFLMFSLLWLLLISNQSFSNMLIKPLENAYPTLHETPADIEYILVLGNAHKTNSDYPITSELNVTAINRLVEGIRHYNNLGNAKLILSGYAFSDENSHAFMQKKLALSLGVKEEDIITLHTPRTTYEEAIETKKIVEDKKIILVTTASHMKRAALLFEKANVDFIASPTNHKYVKSNYPSSYFSASNINKVELAFHEYLGIIYSYLTKEI